MTRDLRLLLVLAALCLCALSPAAAQTYTPKAIHFEGSPGLDSAELLSLSGWHEGVPITKAEIEAGMQKLADTGAFTGLSYVVNDAALTIKLTSAAGGQALPVRFVNLVWWQPDELLQLLEARVPLFHGNLPLTGSLTDQVQAALVDLLSEKGIPDAKVTSGLSTSRVGGPIDSVALSITSPQVLVGDTRFNGAIPALQPKLTSFSRKLAGQDFDRLTTSETVRQTSAEIFEDAGYLDISNDPPVFAPPRKELDHYVIDEEVTFHPGEIYRIGSINLQAAPPMSTADLTKALNVKVGGVASAVDLRLAESYLAQPYRERAYLTAEAHADLHKDPSTHTVACTFTIVPGGQFRLASVDTSALPPAAQSELARAWHPAPGTLMDQSLRMGLFNALHGLPSSLHVTEQDALDTTNHTGKITIHARETPHS
ncbi:MAG TPA: POTRA domain-containing protein [Acidobacteriaceae bacterium]|nr:POTRA domain-containing protein [Acidobacteriaceae bacterium]